MNLTTAGILLGLVGALALAWPLEPRAAAGVLVGFGAGAGLGGLLASWQARVLRARPAHALRAQTLAFLVKLAFLMASALAVRGIDALSARIDLKLYVLSFAVSIVLVLLLSVFEHARLLRAPRAGSGVS
jgi:hypothetical protein